jgi:hypothetical protein
MAELKHVGRVKSTKKKCLIAYRTLPGDAYSCLIVPTENLPDIYHDAIINLVESGAGQDAYEFAEALDRTQFPDGSRMLPALHASGRLIKVGTSEIEMTPTPQFSILLSELNQMIAEQRGIAVDDLSIAPQANDEPVAKTEAPKAEGKKATAKVETLVTETTAAPTGTPEEQAKYFRSQADKLAKQAAEMRRKAEDLVPTKKKATK